MREKPYDWVENLRPIRYGGLRVFLWTVVFFLEMFIALECLKVENFPWDEQPAVIILVGLALLHGAFRCSQMVAFMICLLTENDENFKWMWKYIRHNVYSPTLTFSCNTTGKIELRWGSYNAVLRAGASDKDNTRSIRFSLRLGGWFFRRQMVSPVDGAVGAFIDMRNLLRKSWRYPPVKIHFLDDSVIVFPSFTEAVDYLLDGYRNPSGTIEDLTDQVKKLGVLESSHNLVISLMYLQHEMLLVIQNSLRENPRLAEHRTANPLMEELLEKLAVCFDESAAVLRETPHPDSPFDHPRLQEVMLWLKQTRGIIQQLEEAKARPTKQKSPTASQEPSPDNPPTNSPAE